MAATVVATECLIQSVSGDHESAANQSDENRCRNLLLGTINEVDRTVRALLIAFPCSLLSELKHDGFRLATPSLSSLNSRPSPGKTIPPGRKTGSSDK